MAPRPMTPDEVWVAAQAAQRIGLHGLRRLRMLNRMRLASYRWVTFELARVRLKRDGIRFSHGRVADYIQTVKVKVLDINERIIKKIRNMVTSQEAQLLLRLMSDVEGDIVAVRKNNA